MARCVLCSARAEIKPGLSRRVLRQAVESPAQALLRRVLWEARTRLTESLATDIERELAPRPPEWAIARIVVCRQCGPRHQTIRDGGVALKRYIAEESNVSSLTVRVGVGVSSPGDADDRQRTAGTRTATAKGR